MIIPIQDVEKDTLVSLVQAYVLQEGTEYGEQDVSLETKVQQVLNQLHCGEALLLYSELHETVNIITKQQFDGLTQQQLAEM